MIDSIKEFVSPKRFSILAYVCVILHSMCGVILIGITSNLKLGEMEKFSCAVDTTFATHKTYVEKTCFSIYNNLYNSPVRLFAFVLLSFIPVAVVSVIYSLAVGGRIDETERFSSERRYLLSGHNQPGTRTLYVFYFYFFHLVTRSIFGMLLAILQFTVLYPNGFDSQFICIYPKLTQQGPNITAPNNASVPPSSVTCENLAAQDKLSCSYAVFGCNIVFTVIVLLEVICMIKGLTKRGGFPCFKPKSWSCDLEFVIKYFLRKQLMPEDIMVIGVDIPTADSLQIYKEKVLNAPLSSDDGLDTKTSLDDIFVDVVIQTEQAPMKFSTYMTRREINDVYMKVPEHSIRLEDVKDLFYSNKDTENKSPQTILALGRPGIGKTVLTRKIMRDWAKGIDKFYRGKIAFYFKIRWFHFEQLQNVTLKKFLQILTGLSENEFKPIYEEILANPKNTIFMFDGLDEFGGNLKKFQNFVDQSKMSPNDPTCPMSAMSLFIKIMSDQILPGATVLVTSRPTAHDVLSKLSFDRKVEIIGFTDEKIENYVEKFCANHKKSELKPKIWSHIKSSELKNLCYIPVNCFIVCVTLLNCLSNQGNDNALPATLTGLYQAALVYFHKNHDRNETKEQYEKVMKDLQHLAFHGMKNDRLIFDDELVNGQMKESGLLHCLPVPFFQIQTQVCFIHLSVQEFLAAKYIVLEKKEPGDLKDFISSHVKHGKWHLVLQFLAGLLGKKMEMSEEYRSCVLAFGEHFCPEVETEGENIVFKVFKFNDVMLMKCVREAENEDIAKQIAMTSALETITMLPFHYGGNLRSPSDWAALVFIYKHLNRLKRLSVDANPFENIDCVLEITKLLRHRCLETLEFTWCRISLVHEVLKHLLGAITTSECRINHEHSKLAHLNLSKNNITDDDISILTEFLKNGHGVCLKSLNLRQNIITSVGICRFCDVLGHEVGNKLEVLNLGWNNIGDDGMRILCKALKVKQHRLKELHLDQCSLTSTGTTWLGQVFQDKNCEITHLDICSNRIGDKGVHMLCDGFRKGNCELDVLNLSHCSLTRACMPYLSKFLEYEKCRLTDLSLSYNNIGDAGAGLLFDALLVKKCSLTKLDLSGCSLTKNRMASLCEVLGGEHCQLTNLNLQQNYIGDDGVEMLCCSLEKEQCKLTELNLSSCSLTDKCIVSLCKALRNCRLTELRLHNPLNYQMKGFLNEFTSRKVRLLLKVEQSEHCRARGLRINVLYGLP